MIIFPFLRLIKFQHILKNFMRILIITNYNHNASKEIVKFLKFKKLKFDHIDSNKKKKLKFQKTMITSYRF